VNGGIGNPNAMPAELLIQLKTTLAPLSVGWLAVPFVRFTEARGPHAGRMREAMTSYDDFEIAVTADWNDWRSANARLGDLHDLHWHQPQRAPQPMIHAYLSCANIVSGDLPHHCDPSSAPHRIRVCVLRSHNIAPAYAELVRRADHAKNSSCQHSVRRMNSVVRAATRAR